MPASKLSDQDSSVLKQAVERITQLATQGTMATPLGEVRQREIVFAPLGGMRLPVTVKAGTQGDAWKDDEFGDRFYRALLGVGAEQLEETVNKFAREQIFASPTFGGGAPAPSFGAPAGAVRTFRRPH